jgi:hypothetical protein
MTTWAGYGQNNESFGENQYSAMGTSLARDRILPIDVIWKVRSPPNLKHRARVIVLRQQLLLLDDRNLISAGLGRFVVFGHGMRKKEAEAQEHHCDSYQMAEHILWRRLHTLCHRNLLSV